MLDLLFSIFSASKSGKVWIQVQYWKLWTQKACTPGLQYYICQNCDSPFNLLRDYLPQTLWPPLCIQSIRDIRYIWINNIHLPSTYRQKSSSDASYNDVSANRSRLLQEKRVNSWSFASPIFIAQALHHLIMVYFGRDCT